MTIVFKMRQFTNPSSAQGLGRYAIFELFLKKIPHIDIHAR